MRFFSAFILVISTGLLPVGCISSSTPAISKAKEKIGEAGDASVAAAKAMRDEFTHSAQKTFDELDAKCKTLEQRAAEAKGDAKKDLNDKVKVAQAKRDVAAKKLVELKEASHNRWEKVKDGVGSALEDLKKVFE